MLVLYDRFIIVLFFYVVHILLLNMATKTVAVLMTCYEISFIY